MDHVSWHVTCSVLMYQSEEAHYDKWHRGPTHHDSSLTAPEASMAVTQMVFQSILLQQTYLIITLMRKPWLILSSSITGFDAQTQRNFFGIYLTLKLGHSIPFTGDVIISGGYLCEEALIYHDAIHSIGSETGNLKRHCEKSNIYSNTRSQRHHE